MKIKKSVKRILIIALVILLVAFLAYGGYTVYKKYKASKGVKTTEIVDKIDEYGYYLEEDAPKGYKNLFEELVKVLKKEEVDEEAYAKLVAQMLALDFYNLDNKMSKNDIGGTQFIMESYRKNFVLEAGETVYKYIEHNVYGNRKQELPVVTEVKVESVNTNSYKYDNITDDKAYIVKVNITYEKDLGYPTSITVKLVHTTMKNEKTKLEVFYMK